MVNGTSKNYLDGLMQHNSGHEPFLPFNARVPPTSVQLLSDRVLPLPGRRLGCATLLLLLLEVLLLSPGQLADEVTAVALLR